MSLPPDVTIILLVRDDPAGARRALAAVGDDPAAEILAVGAVEGWPAPADARLRTLAGGGGEAAAAWNLGIATARAPLLAFLDSADRWLPGKLGPQRGLHAGYPTLGFSFTDARTGGGGRPRGGGVLDACPRFRAAYPDSATPFLLGPEAPALLAAEPVLALSTIVARADLLRAAGGFATTAEVWPRLAAMAPVACLPGVTALLGRRGSARNPPRKMR